MAEPPDTPAPDDADADALAWLAGLPAGTLLRWTTHAFSLRQPFSLGWVDVYCPPLCDAVGWNWAWTVERPDPIPEDQFSFPVAFDAQLEMRLPDGAQRATPEQVRLRVSGGRVLDL